MSAPTAAVSQPSMAGDDVVYLCAGVGWRVAAGERTPQRLSFGEGRLRHLMGDPDGEASVAVVEHSGTVEVRVLNRPGAEPVLALAGAGPVTPLAWLDRATILMGVDEHDGGGAPITLIEIELDTPGEVRLSELSHLRSLDSDRSGRRVAVTAGVHPAHVREWRGGSRGRLLRRDGHGRWRSESSPWANPADACILGDRVYVLDDPAGPVDLFSRPLDGGPVRCHGLASRGHVTSLRRGRDRLVVGVSGAALVLDPVTGALHDVPEPPVQDHPPVGQLHPWSVQAWSADAAGSAAAGVGEGRLVVACGHGDGTWTMPLSYGWVIAADWAGPGTLVAVVRDGDHTRILEIAVGAFTITPQTLPVGAMSFHPDEATAGPSGVVLSSALAGVLSVARDGRVQELERRPAHRRGAPVLSSDGTLVAWAEEDELAGAVIRIARLGSDACETIVVPGAGAHLPVFDSHDQLLFVSTPVSPLTGSAAPVRQESVLCSVDPAQVLDGVGRSPRGAPASVQVLARGLREVTDVTVDGETSWVRDRSGLRSIDVQGRINLVDEAASASVGGRPGAAVPRRRREQISRLAGTRVAPGAASGAWTMRRCLDLINAHAVSEPEQGPLWASAATLLGWAERCVGEDELDVALRCALRQVGRSHTALLPSVVRDTTGALESRSRVAEARDRARDRLAGRAHYVAVPDVSTTGVHVVESLCRSWRGDAPLVLDLRYNVGGPFADYLAALLSCLLSRDATAVRPGGSGQRLLGGPAFVNVLVNEHTGSGGEHLAAALARHPHVLVLGRRSAGAGTGFHRRWPVGLGRWVTLPQYRLGSRFSMGIENRGVEPDLWSGRDPTAGAAHDDALLEMLPVVPTTSRRDSPAHRHVHATPLDEGGAHDRAAV